MAVIAEIARHRRDRKADFTAKGAKDARAIGFADIAHHRRRPMRDWLKRGAR